MIQRSTWRRLGWVAAVFVMAWVIEIIICKVTYRVPSLQDVALYGLGLPILLIVGFVGLRGGIDRLRRIGMPTRTASLTPTGTSPTATEDATRHYTVSLLGSSVRLPAGATADEVIAVAKERDVVSVHRDYGMGDGSRAFASSVADVDVKRFDEIFSDGQASGLDVEQKRALICAIKALDDLCALPAFPTKAATTDAAPSSELALPALRVLLPQRWEKAAPVMLAGLAHHLANGPWGGKAPVLTAVLVKDPAEALADLDALLVDLHTHASEARHILLACDSWLSQKTVTTWEDTRKLYWRKHTDGRLPGEGACALLVGRQAAEDAEPAAQIHRLVAGRREISADQPDLRFEDALSPLLEQARVGTAPPDLTMDSCALVSDADQRHSRSTEIIHVAQQAWPGIDVSRRCLHLGLANGESGAVLALSAIAIAAAHSLNEQQPTFAVSLSDAFARTAVLISPPPPPTDSAAPSLMA